VLQINIHLVAKNELETEGIRWIVESHITDAKIKTWDSLSKYVSTLQNETPDLLLLDMDAWNQENEHIGELLRKTNIRWIGISSERIFQTAYRALQFKAKDVLFRPFPPADLVKHIQQFRYQLRNEQGTTALHKGDIISNITIDYNDFILLDRMPTEPLTMVAFLTQRTETLPRLYEQLQHFSFTKAHQLFVLSDFILCVHKTEDNVFFQEAYHTFLVHWKGRVGEPLAVVSKDSSSFDSLKETYLQTKKLTEEVFFEGYDIILSTSEQVNWLAMDPFLTPLEQRKWIEMLEMRDAKGLRDWVEHEFLTYERPYPDPEIVRVRLTSVLAQIRRYMKSYNIQTEEWEAAYYAVFERILRSPIIYEIVQELLTFTTRLILPGTGDFHLQGGNRSLVEKTKALIESNYWNAQWNLVDCAESLRMNKSTLSRRFAAESGQLFRVVLHQVKIQEAKRLLRETDLSMEEISHLVGYLHSSYFTMKFKELEKCTPSNYRMGIQF